MLNKMTLEQIYLSWVNDFLTLEAFTHYYKIDKYTAKILLRSAGKIYEKEVDKNAK